jgi:outer membrane protein TolC
VVQARTRALEAEVTLRGAADAVLLLMGELPGQDVVPVTEVGDAPEEVVDVAAAIERSLAGNLDLAVAKAQLDLAHRQLSWAKHGRLPSLAATASGGVGAQATTLGDSLGGIVGPEAFPYVRLGGQLDVPIGNRSARANVGQAEATVRQREFDVAETERRIRSDVAIQVARLQTARRAVDLADLNVRLAEETLAAEEALAEAGRRIQKDVLDARLAVEQAAVEAVRARTSWRQAHVELLRLQGALR